MTRQHAHPVNEIPNCGHGVRHSEGIDRHVLCSLHHKVSRRGPLWRAGKRSMSRRGLALMARTRKQDCADEVKLIEILGALAVFGDLGAFHVWKMGRKGRLPV